MNGHTKYGREEIELLTEENTAKFRLEPRKFITMRLPKFESIKDMASFIPFSPESIERNASAPFPIKKKV
ncbi:MAG: hypothetical protein ACEQSE_01500 [Candidatus Aquirickettsiella gammari]